MPLQNESKMFLTITKWIGKNKKNIYLTSLYFIYILMLFQLSEFVHAISSNPFHLLCFPSQKPKGPEAVLKVAPVTQCKFRLLKLEMENQERLKPKVDNGFKVGKRQNMLEKINRTKSIILKFNYNKKCLFNWLTIILLLLSKFNFSIPILFCMNLVIYYFNYIIFLNLLTSDLIFNI